MPKIRQRVGITQNYNSMKQKILFYAIFLVAVTTMTSCGTPQVVRKRIPVAVNTVNSVRLDELNLKHGTDYTIVNTITSEATVIYSENRKGEKITLREENGEFKITFELNNELNEMIITDFEGVARFGFLTNDDYRQNYSLDEPEYVVRNAAIYRLINASKVRGADGVIEPVVSTNVEQRGRDIVFKTTVSAKLIKLKTDAK